MKMKLIKVGDYVPQGRDDKAGFIADKSFVSIQSKYSKKLSSLHRLITKFQRREFFLYDYYLFISTTSDKGTTICFRSGKGCQSGGVNFYKKAGTVDEAVEKIKVFFDTYLKYEA